MHIQLNNVGKKYQKEWIFRHCNYQFSQANAYAIIGPNGSGKSTLLQAIAGSMHLQEGTVTMMDDQSKIIPVEEWYQQVAIVAPYLEIIEEMTATEFLTFHFQFKKRVHEVSIADIIQIIGLQQAANKQIRYFSSGMKQRIKLAQAIFSDTSLLLLDEPCTNLDASGYALYQKLIAQYCQTKIVVVCSNDLQEYGFCKHQLKITDYK